MNSFSPTFDFAKQLDSQDPLASYRDQFIITDPDLISFCDGLLESGEKEDWFLALKAITVLDTPEAIEKLVMIFAGTLSNDDRLYIINLVARSLTADFVHPFSIMVRDLAHPGEIDISDWTKTAISTLQDVCKRYRIATVLETTCDEYCTKHQVVEEDILKA